MSSQFVPTKQNKEFKIEQIEKLYINEVPWFKRAHIGKLLEINHIATSTSKLMVGDKKPRAVLMTKDGYRTTDGWSGPSDDQNNSDIFLLLTGALYTIVNSQKTKAIALKNHILRDIVPRGFNAKLEQIQENYQRAIKEREDVIEEKDAAIALLNDDLEDVGRQLVDLEHENHELQNEVERLQKRYVPYLQDTRKENGMVIVQKNNDDEYDYVAICGQQGYVTQKIQNKLTDYPNGQLVVLAETPNAIVHYNWLRERGCIIANPGRAKHFKLGQHYTHKQLMELQEV